MASKKHKPVPENEKDSLKGTLYSVFGLGIFIIATWIMVFSIFIDRF